MLLQKHSKSHTHIQPSVNVVICCENISMGQSSSKGPKQSPKRGSVQAEATTTKNVQRTIFDHVIEQIVEKSSMNHVKLVCFSVCDLEIAFYMRTRCVTLRAF